MTVTEYWYDKHQWMRHYRNTHEHIVDDIPSSSPHFKRRCAFFIDKDANDHCHSSQKNVQVGPYSRTLVKRLLHYVFEYQKDWDANIQPLTYAYSMQIHRATESCPSKVIRPGKPPSAATFDILTGPASDMHRDVAPQRI